MWCLSLCDSRNQTSTLLYSVQVRRSNGCVGVIGAGNPWELTRPQGRILLVPSQRLLPFSWLHRASCSEFAEARASTYRRFTAQGELLITSTSYRDSSRHCCNSFLFLLVVFPTCQPWRTYRRL